MKARAWQIFNFLRRGITPAGILCIMLGILGCVAIYNATFHLPHPFKYVTKQLIWLGPAFLVLITTSATPPRVHKSWGLYISGFLYLTLWAVLVLGVRVNGMRGWFAWHGIFMQPSELGKPAFVLLLAVLIAKLRQQQFTLLHEFLGCLAFLGAWVLPIALQPDFGTLMVYIFAFAATYVCTGGRIRYLMAGAVGALPLIGLSIMIKPYIFDRICAFLHPSDHLNDAAWHIRQFQVTLASGGLFGRSWGGGVWTQNYLPFGYSDSVFATVGEAIGFVGLMPFIVFILAYVLYAYRRIQHTTGEVRILVIYGAVFMLTGQAFFHLSVNLGIFPPTGLPLPLISYGGSSLVATLALVGLVESMSRIDNY
ncbi:MAG: FtsW/RodA/SpoVE family cell cycle protein [Lentisphaeria bacterium]